MRVLNTLLILLIVLSACSTPATQATPSATTAPTIAAEATRSLPTATPLPARPSPTPAPPTPSPAPTIAMSGPLADILARVAVSRGLPVKRNVSSAAFSRDELRAYLIKSAEEQDVKQELEKTKALLVALELLDPDEDLYKVWLEALTEQVAGFYEFQTQQMKLVKSGDLNTISTSDEMILAHEYTHALQDQHFNLGSMFDRVKARGEATSALQALTEGDATLSMAEYARQYKTPEELAEFYGKPTRMDASKLRSAPYVIQSSLLFPYQQGGAFVAGLHQQGGWATVNAAYSRPPTSTEQILHPDRYRRGDDPQNVDLPNVAAALGGQWQQYSSDTVGELGWIMYLAGGGLSRAPTAGWGGDRYVIFRDSEGKLALASVIVWDTSRNATEFFVGLREMQKARRGTTLPVLTDRKIAWAGKTASGYSAVDGFNVLLVITPDEATTQKVAARFPGFGS